MIGWDHVWLLPAALVVDAIIGDPRVLWRRIPHPVVTIGALIRLLDLRWNRTIGRACGRARGTFAVLLVAGVSWLAGYVLERSLATLPYGSIVVVLIAAVLLAGRSLHDHVSAVERALATGLVPARTAVAQIVGRDPDSLDESGICRAAIESTAENYCDGVVAPALWFVLLGLPGMLAYKAVNTADSMIGHVTPQYREFGWAAARLDDLLNLPASRLAGAMIALAAPLAGGNVAVSLRVMLSDGARHRSPNAGWPEAAMAGVLGLALGGPRRYAGLAIDEPFLNAADRRDAAPVDIARALAVYRGAWTALLLASAGAAAAVLL